MNQVRTKVRWVVNFGGSVQKINVRGKRRCYQLDITLEKVVHSHSHLPARCSPTFTRNSHELTHTGGGSEWTRHL